MRSEGNHDHGSAPATVASARRTELAAFLRARRERISPEDVGLPPGTRRRTAGLRREELAQLAGVGVTWYTWLEQGRPINASVQVLDAIATTLRLDAVERAHLFRLADLPGAGGRRRLRRLPPAAGGPAGRSTPSRFPACVLTERFDVIAWNDGVRVALSRVPAAPPGERNTLLVNLTAPSCCSPMQDPDEHCLALVGQLRARLRPSRGRPGVDALHPPPRGAQPDVRGGLGVPRGGASRPGTPSASATPTVGHLTTTSTSFAVNAVPGARLVVYTPDDEPSEQALARLAAGASSTPASPAGTPTIRNECGLPQSPADTAGRD